MLSTAPPVSDPQLNRSTLVQQTSSPLHPIQNMGGGADSDPAAHRLSSDQKPATMNNSLHSDKFEIKHKEEGEEENGSNNNSRKEYNFLAVGTVGETRVLPSLSSHPVEGRWDDGDEKIPSKKRKGGVEEEETVLKMKPKANKKFSTSGMQQNQVKAGSDESNSTLNNNTVKKMNKRGGAIMEGSRCSRVNGRGWRCCQQTLVGYSLCEHHLGKGRLRSISNVKGRKTPAAAAAATIAPQNVTTDSSINDSTSKANTTNDNESSKKLPVSLPVVQSPRPRDRKNTMLLDGSCYDDDEEEDKYEDDDDDDDYNEEETKKPVVAKKKRMKVGMVKARSLSSLLNRTN
uniref:WRC domain-containing protein n=2 Tax=Daucus carota subsp. sativus TaxID=79200 RepID=A0A164XZ56_DAUCS